jgi:penicillin V acylase-like amidase (Ntn superfamily)
MSKKYALAITAAFLVLMFFNTGIFVLESHSKPVSAVSCPGGQCTSACITNNGYAVLGSNNDTGYEDGMLYINKRGLKKTSRYMDSSNLNGPYIEWTSKYASVTFAVQGYAFPWCGLNEKGLAFGTMALAQHVPPVDQRAYMTTNFWWQYILDTCETIDDIRATDSLVRLWTMDHFLVTDRFGNSAAIEFVNGHMVIYEGGDLPISALTNTDYQTSAQTWEGVKHTSDSYSNLDDSLQRFCLAADLVDDFHSTTDAAAVNYVFNILETVGWYPKATESFVMDSKNLRMYYRTRLNPQIKYIDLFDFDLSCKSPVQMLEVQNGLSGAISDDFKDVDWDEAIAQALDFSEWYGDVYPQEYLDLIVSIITNYPCSEKKEEGALITADSAKPSADIRCALDPNTGNVLVVWTELDATDQSYGQVKSAMLWRSLDGIYSASEYQALSDGKSYSSRPFPIFLSSSDQFLVAWDQADPSKPSAKSAILGRLLSARGLPEGKIITIAAGKKRNEAPHLYERALKGTTPGGKTASVRLDLVYYTAKAGKSGLSQPSLCISQLSGTFKAGKPSVLLTGAVKTITAALVAEKILPAGVGRVIGLNIMLPVEHGLLQDNGSVVNQPKVLVIDENNKRTDIENLGNPGSSRAELSVFEDSNGAAYLLGSTVSNKSIVNTVLALTGTDQAPALDLLSSSTESMKAEDALPLMLSNVSAIGVPPAANNVVGYQFYASTKGRVYSRPLADTGRTSGKYAQVIKKAKGVDALAGVEIALLDKNGKPVAGKEAEMLIIWHMSIKGEDEIRAAVWTVKK